MRIPPSFFLSVGRFLLFIAIETACIIMISRNGIVQRYRLIEKIRDIQSFFWEKGMDVKTYGRLRKINGNLARQMADLMKENEKYRQIIAGMEGEAFADSIRYGSSEETVFGYTWARVIKNTLNSLHNYVIIDKGRADGLTEDMGVITPDGVVGIIRAVGEHNAFVFSFFNADQSVSARIGRTQALGTLVWNKISPDGAVLNEIPQHIEVMPGDTVYTSGYSSLFPPDIPLGRTEDSRIVNGTHRAVNVRLFLDPGKIEYVIVVKNNYGREIDSLSNYASPHE